MAKSPKKILHRQPGNRLDTQARAGRSVSPVPASRAFRHAVFASEAEYDRSVASVVARIRSGQVPARTPDE